MIGWHPNRFTFPDLCAAIIWTGPCCMNTVTGHDCMNTVTGLDIMNTTVTGCSMTANSDVIACCELVPTVLGSLWRWCTMGAQTALGCIMKSSVAL
jgi:hypothetical protein